MEDPKRIAEFIEKSGVGYLRGHAIRSIIFSAETIDPKQQLEHLKDARNFLNGLIRDLTRKKVLKLKSTTAPFNSMGDTP